MLNELNGSWSEAPPLKLGDARGSPSLELASALFEFFICLLYRLTLPEVGGR